MYHDKWTDTSVPVTEMVKHPEEGCAPDGGKRENIVENLWCSPCFTQIRFSFAELFTSK